MATDTPNFNWPIPEDTDLVKDGAKAIRDLGNAIDTSAQDFGGGLVHIETQLPSAVSAVPLNNVFSSTYDNYLIMFTLLPSATNELQIRLRASETDAAGSNYFWHRANTSSNGTGYGTGANGFGATSFLITGAGFASATRTGFIKVYSPFLSKRTMFQGMHTTPFSGDFQGGNMFCDFNLSTSFDGFSILTASGTFTGEVRVYGYRN